MGSVTHDDLEALVEEAIVDAYGDEEQTVGFLTMIADYVAVPFSTRLLGVAVEVVGFDISGETEIVAVCTRGTRSQRVLLVDLEVPDPPPDGAVWIAAWRHWCQR